MPYCTACGHQNPDDARFCSQCGTRIVGAEPVTTTTGEQAAVPASDASGGGAGDATETMTFRAPTPAEQADDRPLNDEDAAAVDALPAGSALLVVQRGPDAGSRFLLDTDVVTAGRHPDSEIFLDDVTVSRRHAEFRRTPEGFRVCDVGSLNGTYVNRDRIDEVALSGGDEVQIGKYRLVFFAGQAAPGR
jgi:pSer/pThr/pTyr-binding forkhead associated (FHA) protein